MEILDRGLSPPFKGPGGIANVLTGIKCALVNCLFIPVGAEYTKDFNYPPTEENSRGLKSGEREGHTSKSKHLPA